MHTRGGLKMADLKMADPEIDFSLDSVSHFQVCHFPLFPISIPPAISHAYTQTQNIVKSCFMA